MSNLVKSSLGAALIFAIICLSTCTVVKSHPASTSEPVSPPTYPDENTGNKQTVCPDACYNQDKANLLAQPVYFHKCFQLWEKGYCRMDERFLKKCVDAATTARPTTASIAGYTEQATAEAASTCPPCPETPMLRSVDQFATLYTNGTAHKMVHDVLYVSIVILLFPATYGIWHLISHHLIGNTLKWKFWTRKNSGETEGNIDNKSSDDIEMQASPPIANTSELNNDEDGEGKNFEPAETDLLSEDRLASSNCDMTSGWSLDYKNK